MQGREDEGHLPTLISSGNLPWGGGDVCVCLGDGNCFTGRWDTVDARKRRRQVFLSGSGDYRVQAEMPSWTELNIDL